MATVTAVSLIRQALIKIGVLAWNEEPDAPQGQDGLSSLNNLMDGWSAERLMIPVTQETTLAWPASQATRTIGPTGNFVQARPIKIESAAYEIPGSNPPVRVDLPVLTTMQDTAQSIPALTSTLPITLYYQDFVIGSENGLLRLWPIPTQPITVVILIPIMLTAFADLITAYQMPPSYIRALVHNLAVEMSPDYGMPVPAIVDRIATGSKRLIKSLNALPVTLKVDAALAPQGGSYNVYSDQGS